MLSKLSLGLVPPEEIRADEVLCFWEKLDERTPHGCYTVYRSPNRELRAWMQDTAVALMWNVHTGQVHQADAGALYDFISKLGGWI